MDDSSRFADPRFGRPPSAPSAHSRGRRSKSRSPLSYQILDVTSEILLLAIIIIAPWLFGSADRWAVWTLTIASYLLGLALLGKWIVRWVTGFQPARWNGLILSRKRPLQPGEITLEPPGHARSRAFTCTLAGLTLFILLFTLTSALNARATYLPWEGTFEYHDSISWLPRSYDSGNTWFVFWQLLGLACFFWSARDWLLGKTRQEKELDRGSHQDPSPAQPLIPNRLRRLMWVIYVNGAVLGLEAILQRLSGTNKVLWLIEPHWNKSNISQFGPYPYRSNAAQYFNLIWPVCLGFYFMLRSEAARVRRVSARVGQGNHLLLLPGIVLMAACPIIATTRGGALIAMSLIIISAVIWILGNRKEHSWSRAGILLLFLIILGFAGFLGWKELEARFETVFSDDMSKRGEIYENAERMADDFVWLGSGPGTFGPLYRLYRVTHQIWHEYAHNDWLEFRITFGRIGFGAILIMLALVCARWFVAPSGLPIPGLFTAMLLLAMAGCLVHARFDFPFRVYSIVVLFLTHCAILFTACRSNDPVRVFRS